MMKQREPKGVTEATIVARKSGGAWVVDIEALQRSGAGETLGDALIDAASRLQGEYAAPERVDPLLTRDEVAALLRCSASYVSSLASRGDLHALRIGKLVRIRRSSVVKYAGGEICMPRHDDVALPEIDEVGGDEAARITGLSRAYVTTLIHRGVIRGRKRGGKFFADRSALEEFVANPNKQRGGYIPRPTQRGPKTRGAVGEGRADGR
jgi:excisionase family DNA binding protein